MCVDSRTTRRCSGSKGLNVVSQDVSQGGVVKRLIKELRLDARHAAVAGLIVQPLAVWGDFELVGVDISRLSVLVQEVTFGRYGKVSCHG